MIALFAVERDGEGRAVIKPPGGKTPGERQMFERRCFLNGVTEPEVVEALWRAHCAKRDAARRGAKREGGRR